MFDAVPGGHPVIARQGDCQTCFMCEAYCPVDAMFVAPQTDAVLADSPFLDEEFLVASGLLGKYRRDLGWRPGDVLTATKASQRTLPRPVRPDGEPAPAGPAEAPRRPDAIPSPSTPGAVLPPCTPTPCFAAPTGRAAHRHRRPPGRVWQRRHVDVDQRVADDCRRRGDHRGGRTDHRRRRADERSGRHHGGIGSRGARRRRRRRRIPTRCASGSSRRTRTGAGRRATRTPTASSTRSSPPRAPPSIELAAFPNGPNLNQAIQGGALDIGMYGDTPAMVAKSGGLDSHVLVQSSVGIDAWIVTKAGGPATVET